MKNENSAVIRIEELSPFPRSELIATLAEFKSMRDVVWAQEEPENQGAWGYVRPRIEGVLESLRYHRKVRYAGRKSGATTATGVGVWHKREVEDIVKDAFLPHE